MDGVFYEDENLSVQCFYKDYKEGWYLNADENSNLEQPIIYCSAEKGCQVQSVEYPGWYINNEIYKIYNYGEWSNATVYPLIQCLSPNSCSFYKNEIGNKCGKNGNVIYTGDENEFSFKLKVKSLN